MDRHGLVALLTSPTHSPLHQLMQLYRKSTRSSDISAQTLELRFHAIRRIHRTGASAIAESAYDLCLLALVAISVLERPVQHRLSTRSQRFTAATGSAVN